MSVQSSVCPSVGPSVRNAFFSAGRDEPANNLIRVYKLVFFNSGKGKVAERCNCHLQRYKNVARKSVEPFVCPYTRLFKTDVFFFTGHVI